MIFFEQFKVPTIKFGKGFAELMISIALPEAEFYFGHLKQDIQEFHKKVCFGSSWQVKQCCCCLLVTFY